MNKLDKAIIGLGADAAISTVLHIRYLKSKGSVAAASGRLSKIGKLASCQGIKTKGLR